MKKYTDLSIEEVLNLTNEELMDAIKTEALDRGLQIPLPLPEQLQSLNWKGLTIPAESLKLYELTASGSYGANEPSGIAFETEEQAKKAMEGAISVYNEGYGQEQNAKISKGSVGIRVVHVGLAQQKSIEAKLEAHFDECSDYEDLRKELVDDFSEKRQTIYNKQVREAKRAEFMRLANGDISIAKAFWSKQEIGEFPSVPDAATKELFKLL